MKKIIAFIPVWVLFYIGDLISKTFNKLDSIILYRLFSWCMVTSSNIQDWAKLKNPWHETKPSKLEIERRWLLKELPILKFDEFSSIRQYYTPAGRFRELYNGSEYFYYFTIKTTIAVGINKEEETQITKGQFDEAIKTATSYICKDRRKYKDNGLIYEFDSILLSNDNTIPSLYIMEVELDDINQPITIPNIIQDVIIREITGEKQYSNFALSIKI